MSTIEFEFSKESLMEYFRDSSKKRKDFKEVGSSIWRFIIDVEDGEEFNFEIVKDASNYKQTGEEFNFEFDPNSFQNPDREGYALQKIEFSNIEKLIEEDAEYLIQICVFGICDSGSRRILAFYFKEKLILIFTSSSYNYLSS